MPLPPSGWRLAAWIAGGALILLALLLAALVRRRTSRPSAASARPAHLLKRWRSWTAWSGRGSSRAARWPSSTRRLADILRHYALHRFGLSAPTQTTEELLAGLAGLSLADGPGRTMAPLLTDCDLVKFARHRPSGAAAEQALQGARSFVGRRPTTAGEATAPA